MKFNNERIKMFKQIYPLIKTQKHLYFALYGFDSFFLLLSLITPVFYMMLINNVMLAGEMHYLIWIILGYIGVYLLQSLAKVLNKLVYNKFFNRVILLLKKRILTKLFKLDYKQYIQYDAGDLKNRVENDVSALEKFLNIHCLNYLYSIVSSVVIACILIYMDWMLALFGLITIPLSFLFAKIMGKKSTTISKSYREKYGEYESFLHVSMQNWKEIKSNNLQSNVTNMFSHRRDYLSKLFVKKEVFGFINRTFIAFKDFFIVKMKLYFVGGLLIINGQMNVGALLVFMSYYEQLFTHISAITASILDYKNEQPLLVKIFEILDTKTQEKNKVTITGNNINISDVSFRYDNSHPLVLEDVNLAINDKEHIALVGRSGCGKSTLSKLMLGMYEPSSGVISIGGYDISKITVESIGKKISVVMQEPFLFNLTIRENLLLVKKHATQKELDDACSSANIFEFIQSLPHQYETIVGEKGVKLSGGQRQRLSIARTILLNPDIIIFDEATSALDYINEKAIIASINALSKEKTIISIAHRLSSIIHVDKVIVIDKGKIIASGRHNELKDKNEIYDLLFKAQYVKE